jgi:hypothetical protein
VFIRKVKTGSGAIAIQIARREAKRDVVIKHIGSAHCQSEIDLLVKIAKDELTAGQESLFPSQTKETNIVALGASSIFLFDTLLAVYQKIFSPIDDDIFRQLVIARLIEPTSKLDTIRVLSELGLSPPSKDQIGRTLAKGAKNDYRSLVSHCCFNFCQQSSPAENLSLLLYDVTTLYFEIQKEDDFRKPGLSKERRLEPQIIIGLLVDQTGFPLEISEFEGSKAETKTIIPVLESFCQKHHLDKAKITVTADAGMLSASNLKELEDLGFYFIVGSRISKTPYQIAAYHQDCPNQELTDGQIFEATKTFGLNIESRRAYRVIYQYRKKRAGLDLHNLEKQITKAQKVVAGATPIKKSKFIQIKGITKVLNIQLIKEHRLRAGIKGYVTNLPSPSTDRADGIPPQEIINAYHQLFQVEKSFRMSKSDLKARPIFHHKLDSIKAHLTIVFTALALARFIEARTNLSIKKFIQLLRVIRTPTLLINHTTTQIPPLIPANVENLLQKLTI